MAQFTPLDAIISDRSGITENRHLVHAAVVDSNGTLLFAVGDPSRLTLARSAAKPAQALAVLETGAHLKFNFDDEDIAIMCSSHSSEDRHVKRAVDMLTKSGSRVEDLACGGDIPPLSDEVYRDWIRRGLLSPGGETNNCSAKHAGMLAGAICLGVKKEGYHEMDHAMQVKVREVVEDLAGPDVDVDGGGGVKWGIDGCNLPAPAMPLGCIARGYALFADAAGKAAVRGTTNPSPRESYMAVIFRAMAEYPEMVGGEGRFCTKLMEVYGGQLIGKLGADGCYGVGVRESDDTRRLGAKGGLGISVKIEDGNIAILYAAVVEILEQLGIGSDDATWKRLESFHHLERLNSMKVPVGKVSMAFKVRDVRNGSHI